jgi:protein phosphatase
VSCNPPPSVRSPASDTEAPPGLAPLLPQAATQSKPKAKVERLSTLVPSEFFGPGKCRAVAVPSLGERDAGIIGLMPPVFAGATDQGTKRDHNEDSFAIAEHHQLVIVADGMGGFSFGEVASKLAVDAVVGYYDRVRAQSQVPSVTAEDRLKEASESLVSSVDFANRLVFKLARQQHKNIGTTIVAAQVVEDRVCVAHVGDSRAYLVRKGAIVRLTKDHSAMEEFLQIRPDATPEEIANFPLPNIITRSLGLKPEVKTDVMAHSVEPGDVVLLCSDGLCKTLDDPAIAQIVAAASSLQTAASELIAAANRAGADDNVTAVLLAPG